MEDAAGRWDGLRSRGLLPWALGGVGILIGAAIGTIALCPESVCVGVGKPWGVWLDIVIALSFLGVAAVISIQAPRNRLAGLLAVIGVVKLIELNLGEWGGDPALWHWARMLLLALVWHSALSFPTGDPGRSGWWLSGVWFAWGLVGGAARAAWAEPASLSPGVEPVAAAGAPDVAATVLAVVPRVSDVMIVITLSVLIGRYVRGDRRTRQAMAPLLVIVPIVILTVFDEMAVDAGWADEAFLAASAWVEVATLAVPWGIVAGLARSRLWGGEVAGLVAAAETASTAEEVERVAGETLRDPSVRLGLVRPGSDELVTVDGQPFPDVLPGRVRRPLVVHGERIGVLEHAASVPAAWSEQTAATIGLAVDRQRLQTELRAQMAEVVASRRRVVAAADDARRRIERDLHDGAQQRLLALSMEADRLRRHLEELDAPEDALALAAAIGRDARDAHAELRDLARGMYPPALEAEGLAGALDALGDQLSDSGLAVTAEVDVGRLPAEVEGTLYFVAAEALTNVLEHAGATSVRISVSSDAGRVRLTVADDGRGGATVGAGSGLIGLVDRVGAVDGELLVESPDGGPTVLTVVVPT